VIAADLRAKRALVTGGASGIGLATVELLARNGASVAINDLAGNPSLAQQVARLTGEGFNVIAAPGNVGDALDAGRMVEAAATALGGLDYLINNAATPGTSTPIPPADFETTTEGFWQKLLSINLIGPFRCTRAAAPHLKAARGAIVNTASVSAFGGGGSSSVYCATKAGLVALTREWARALGPEVRVNAVAPGLVEGSNWDCKWTPEYYARYAAELPLGRAGRPADYAEAILFLCAGAGYMTGQTLVVDGGMDA